MLVLSSVSVAPHVFATLAERQASIALFLSMHSDGWVRVWQVDVVSQRMMVAGVQFCMCGPDIHLSCGSLLH